MCHCVYQHVEEQCILVSEVAQYSYLAIHNLVKSEFFPRWWPNRAKDDGLFWDRPIPPLHLVLIFGQDLLSRDRESEFTHIKNRCGEKHTEPNWSSNGKKHIIKSMLSNMSKLFQPQ